MVLVQKSPKKMKEVFKNQHCFKSQHYLSTFVHLKQYLYALADRAKAVDQTHPTLVIVLLILTYLTFLLCNTEW